MFIQLNMHSNVILFLFSRFFFGFSSLRTIGKEDPSTEYKENINQQKVLCYFFFHADDDNMHAGRHQIHTRFLTRFKQWFWFFKLNMAGARVCCVASLIYCNFNLQINSHIIFTAFCFNDFLVLSLYAFLSLYIFMCYLFLFAFLECEWSTQRMCRLKCISWFACIFFLLFLPLLGDCVASKLIEYNLFSHLLSFLRTQIVDAAAVFFCSLFIKVNTHHRNHYPFIYQAFSAWNNFLLYFTSLHSGSRRRRSKKGNALHYRREKKQICSYHFHMKRILNTIDTLRFIFLLFINLLSCTSPPLSLHTAARKIIHG